MLGEERNFSSEEVLTDAHQLYSKKQPLRPRAESSRSKQIKEAPSADRAHHQYSNEVAINMGSKRKRNEEILSMV